MGYKRPKNTDIIIHFLEFFIVKSLNHQILRNINENLKINPSCEEIMIVG